MSPSINKDVTSKTIVLSPVMSHYFQARRGPFTPGKHNVTNTLEVLKIRTLHHAEDIMFRHLMPLIKNGETWNVKKILFTSTLPEILSFITKTLPFSYKQKNWLLPHKKKVRGLGHKGIISSIFLLTTTSKLLYGFWWNVICYNVGVI